MQYIFLLRQITVNKEHGLLNAKRTAKLKRAYDQRMQPDLAAATRRLSR